MKYCQKCGKELFDEAVICPNCGCAVAAEAMKMQKAATENGGLASAAMVFAFLMPLVGFVLGLIGSVKYTDEDYKKKSINAITISIIVAALAFMLMMLL